MKTESPSIALGFMVHPLNSRKIFPYKNCHVPVIVLSSLKYHVESMNEIHNSIQGLTLAFFATCHVRQITLHFYLSGGKITCPKFWIWFVLVDTHCDNCGYWYWLKNNRKYDFTRQTTKHLVLLVRLRSLFVPNRQTTVNVEAWYLK